jgi:hypothetical protein
MEHITSCPLYCNNTFNPRVETKLSTDQRQVAQDILALLPEYDDEDAAIILAIAHVESSFNPEAANPHSTARGLFQFIEATAKGINLDLDKRTDTTASVNAMKTLFGEHTRNVSRRFPELTADQRAAKIYAFHHDGPSLRYGGEIIAQRNLVPQLAFYRDFVACNR